MTRIRSLLALALALAWTTPSHAAEATSTYDALLDYGPNKPAAGAWVDILDVGLRGAADAQGRVRIGGIPPGTHDVVATSWTGLPIRLTRRFAPGRTLADTLHLPGLMLPADPVAALTQGPCQFALAPGCDAGAHDPPALEPDAFRTVRDVQGKQGEYWLAVDQRMPSMLHIGYALRVPSGVARVDIMDAVGLFADEPILGSGAQLGYAWNGVGHWMTLPVEGRGHVRFTAGEEQVDIPFCVHLVGDAANKYAGLAQGTVEGVIVDGKGMPLPDTRVSVFTVRGTAMSDAAGRFRIPAVPVGSRQVVAYPQLREPTRAEVTITAGATAHVRLVAGGPVAAAWKPRPKAH